MRAWQGNRRSGAAPSRDPLRGELRSPLTGRRAGLVTAMSVMV